MASQGTTSRLSQLQMRFQQKQTQEKEMKKSELALSTGDAVDSRALSTNIGAGKVRQMFVERRQRITGIDKSYPLQPISSKSPNTTEQSTGAVSKKVTSTVTTTTKQRSVGVSNYGSNGLINQKQRVPPISATSTTTTISANRKFVTNSYQENESASGKTNPDDIYGSPLENEKFPDSQYLDENEQNTSFAKKLPNVGSLPSKNLNGNTKILKNTAIVKPNSLNIRPTVRATPQSSLNGKTTTTKQPVPSPLRSPEKSLSNNKSTVSSGNSGASSRTPSAMASKASSSVSTPTTPLKPVNAGPPPEGMATCHYCSRNFNEDRLQRHEDICKKAKTKKRRVFDAVKARVEGTEAEQYLKKQLKNKKATTAAAPEKPKPSNWRKKHEEFIAAIRAAKEVQAHLARGGKLSDLPPPPPSENPDYVQCPHCQRRFNEGAASRHIPKCATMLHNKTKKAPAVKKR